jgi:hypothetical protein
MEAETMSEKARSTREALRREGGQILAAGRQLGAVAKIEARGWQSYLRERLEERLRSLKPAADADQNA